MIVDGVVLLDEGDGEIGYGKESKDGWCGKVMCGSNDSESI